jgi:prepilin-type N-terminal cleavage/methylation domain-containing protein
LRRRPAQRSTGFSLLELVIVIVLIGVLMAVAIDRLLVMKAQAESRAMEQVVGSIRSAITIRIVSLLVRGRAGDVADLAGSNPLVTLAETPQNYLGELFGPDPATLAPGSWYFDTRDRVLVYLVESADYFDSGLGVPARARFAILPVFEDLNGNGRFDRDSDTLRGMRLAPVEPYTWNVRFGWPSLL